MNNIELKTEIYNLQQKLNRNEVIYKNVDSTNLSNLVYSPKSEELTILFNRKNIYKYAKVPRSVAVQLFTAESKGKAFHKLINNKYTYTRLSNLGDKVYTVNIGK